MESGLFLGMTGMALHKTTNKASVLMGLDGRPNMGMIGVLIVVCGKDNELNFSLSISVNLFLSLFAYMKNICTGNLTASY